MGIYVINSCFVSNIENKIYFTEVLFRFTQQNDLKVGIDNDNVIVEIYEQIAEDDNNIATWLSLMGNEPTSFERVGKINKTTSCQLEKFLCLCKLVVNQNKMIVHSYQTLRECKFVTEHEIEYDGTIIRIFDRDEAIGELKEINGMYNIKDSIVATRGGSVEKVKKVGK